jgi:uncharacterized HAD superfamily protein
MHEYKTKVEEHLEVLREMRNLAHSVEARQTDVDLTTREFLAEAEAHADGMRVVEQGINSQHNRMETYCCRILDSERQRNEMYQRLIQLEETVPKECFE